MKIYHDVFYWFGGVVTETITELAFRALTPGLKGHDGVHMRQQFDAQAGLLAMGHIPPASFCQQAALACQSAVTPAELEQKILETAAARLPVLETARKAPADTRCWLVVDYPAEWYQVLCTHWELGQVFPDSRTIFTTKLGLTRMVPDIFYLLPASSGRPMDACITIDARSHRAVESMRHGLASIIYVYPEQLKLQLALQNIWQTGADVMHPTAGERVNI